MRHVVDADDLHRHVLNDDVVYAMLIQAWAALSEEEREGRRAQMREHNAEVLHKSNHDD